MRGALKVLNDSLKKTSATQLPRAQLKQAIDVVREEWFKVRRVLFVNAFIAPGGYLTDVCCQCSIPAGDQFRRFRWPSRTRLCPLVRFVLARSAGVHNQHDGRRGKYSLVRFEITA